MRNVEVAMLKSRLLLPFTHGLDTLALEYALQLAACRGAVLVALSLIAVPGAKQAAGARLEDIQQSQDFLVALRQKAACLNVALEVCECYSTDVAGSIKDVFQRRQCDGTLFFMRNGAGVLLGKSTIEQIMKDVASTHSVIHLPSRARTRGLQLRRRRLGEQSAATETALS